MLDVGPQFGPGQLRQVITHRDALPQLTQPRMVQPVAQFRLSHEDDLQQFAVLGFEIGQQTDVFELVVVEILRLVDDQYGIAARGRLFYQKLVQHRPRLQHTQSRHGDAEFDGDGLHQQVGAGWRIEDEGAGPGITQGREHRPADRRFARADFAGQLHETLPLADAVEQMVEGLAVFRAEKKEPRIRRKIERRFLQAVIFQIHDGCLTKNAQREKEKVGITTACSHRREEVDSCDRNFLSASLRRRLLRL